MNKSMNISGSGYLYDEKDINQSIHIILNTVKGSDPLRPNFGCGILDYIDKPFLSIKGELISSLKIDLSKYETRIKINSITISYINLGAYKIIINYNIIGSNKDVQYVDVISSLPSVIKKNISLANHTSFDQSFNKDYE